MNVVDEPLDEALADMVKDEDEDMLEQDNPFVNVPEAFVWE